MSARVASAFLVVVTTAAGCSATDHDRDALRTIDEQSARSHRSAIVRGTESSAEQDAVVLLMHYDAIQIGGAAAGCTGTMLTPRLVLTARHCVAVTEPRMACDESGATTFGGAIEKNHLATKLYAFSGNRRPDFLMGLDRGARGLEIIDDAAKTLCNHDIALVLLDRPLVGAKIAPIRLEGGARAGESVTVVGWGVTDKSDSPDARQQRASVEVLDVGPAPLLGPAEFRVGESGCAGDSGGPALAEATGAVLGVLSRGGNGGNAPRGDPSNCLDGDNVFTSTAKYADLILGAYEKAGQAPWREGEPDPTLASTAAAPAGESASTPRENDESGGCSAVRQKSSSRPSAERIGIVGMLIAVLAAGVARRRARSIL